MNNYGLVPLTHVLPFWPSDVFGDALTLEEVALQSYELTYQEDPERIELSGSLIWFQELVVELPLIPGFSVAFLHKDNATIVPFKVEMLPKISIHLRGLDIKLYLQNEFLRPVKRVDNTWEPLLEPLALKMKNINLKADLEGNIAIEVDSSFELEQAVAIGDTGLVLELKGLQPVLSRDQERPDGAPEGFRGLAVTSVKLHLPKDFALDIAPSRLEGNHLLIGSDGFSGTIKGSWSEPTFDPQSGSFGDSDGAGTLFGIPFALREIGLTLRQSTVAESKIRGTMMLPFFDQPINVEIGLAESGLTVTLDTEQPDDVEHDGGLITFTKEDVLEATIQSIAFKADDGRFAITLGGTLRPLVAGVDWPSVEIKALTIDAEGNVDLEGGWIDLPDQYQLDFHGFQLELTRLGLGSNDDGSRWLGLNGELQLVEGLPAGGSMDGLRISWNKGGLQGVRFDGIGIEFEVEDVMHFDGKLAYVEDGSEHRFEGAIDLNLISLGMQLDAQLVIGRKDGYSYMAIYVGAELPAGIPLFTTGLSLYGMAGLYAKNMEPGKTDAQQWYSASANSNDSWYHSGDKQGVADLSKWEARRGSMAFGAGVTIGTTSDNGYAFNGKLLLVILLPGPVILLEGQANLMQKRVELGTVEPNFRTLAVLDNREGSFLFGLDAQYKFDKKEGRLIDIRAGAEAFYSFSDPTAWYCYLGKDEPSDQRIAARIGSLFEATAYYMLDARSLRVGARVGYDLRESAGPLRIELSAWLEMKAALNWIPPHFFGELLLHGNIRLSAFGVGFGLTVDARVAADIFDPFHLLGEFKVKLNLPWPLPDPKATVMLEWGPILNPPPLPLPLKSVTIEHFKTSAKWSLLRSTDDDLAMLRPNYDGAATGYRTEPEGSNELPPLTHIPIVPMDARPYLTFAQPVCDRAQIGINPANPNPEWIRIGDPKKNEGPAKMRFSLIGVALEKRADSNWITVAKTSSDDDAPTLFGSWAPVPPLPLGTQTTDDTSHTPVKLWLWSKNPFAYAMHSGREWEDWFLGEHASFPCIDVPEQRTDRYNFQTDAPNARLDVKHEGTERFWRSKDGVTFKWEESFFEITPRGTIRLAPNNRTVFSSMDWQDQIRMRQETLERSVLQVGRSSERYAIDQITSDRFLNLTKPYSRLLMGAQETRSDFAFYVDPQVVEIPSSSDLSRALAFDFTFNSQTVQKLFSLTIELPREYARVVLDLNIDLPSDLTLFGFDQNKQLQAWTWESIEHGRVTTLVVEGKNLYTLRLYYPDYGKTLQVLQVVGETIPRDVIDERQRMATHLQQETQRWEQTGKVLEPEQTYRLRIETRIKVHGEDELAGYKETKEQIEFAYFRTGNPPGISTVKDNGTQETNFSVPVGHPNPLQFSNGLNDLHAYVAQTIPPTISDSDQSTLQPRPVYRAYDVGVQFNEDYVEQMYRQAQRDLGLYLFDNNDRPIRNNQGHILPMNNHWGNTEALGLAERDARWIETLEHRDCVSVERARIPHSSTLAARARGQLLRPDTTHEARLLPMLLHDSFDGLIFHGWQAIHGDQRDWELDRESNLRGSVDHVNGLLVHLGGSPNISSVTPGLHLFSFDPQTAGVRPAYRVIAINSAAGTVTLDGHPDLVENQSYHYEIMQPGPVRHTARTMGTGTDSLRPGAVIVRGDEVWSDYCLSVYARNETPNNSAIGSIGVVFRQQGSQYYRYALHADPAVRQLTRVDGSTITVLAQENFVYDANRDYQLSIEVIGERIRIYQDGLLVFDITDATYTTGRVGLYAWNSDGAAFRDLRVDDLSASASVAYRFSFITSCYANFYHHLHSYQDETWPATINGDVVSTETLSAICSFAVTQTQTHNISTNSEASAYDELALQALGSQARTFPERIEVTRVEHNGAPIAWLVRSPEPIDWTRTTLSVQQMQGDHAKSSLPSRVKITEAHFGRGADEGLTLLIREQASFKGVRVEYRYQTAGAVPTDLPGSDEKFGGLLLDTSFEFPLDDSWTIVDEAPYSSRSSDWQVRDGELQQTENYYGFVGGMVNAPGTYIITGAAHWSDCRIMIQLRSDDDDAIGVLFRYADEDNYYRFSMDKERTYRRLIRKKNGVVMVLWEDHVRYRSGKFYDLRIDCQGNHLQAWLDENQLFDVTDATHPTGSVGLYCRANKAARFKHLRILAPFKEWTPYHIFDDATIWGDGTMIRLHSTESYVSAETTKHYTASESARQVTPFSPYGIEFRLITADGSTLHKRYFHATEVAEFSTTDLRLLRRADGTGFALVRPTQRGLMQPLQVGQYRLAFTYRRDNRQYDEQSIVLRQNGIYEPEHVTLNIPWETLDISKKM